MNIKHLFFTLLCTSSFVKITGADEYKKEAPNADQDIEVAFMVTTIAPLAQTGRMGKVHLHTFWEHYEANNKHHELYALLLHQGRSCSLHIPHANNESIRITWKRNQIERKNNPLNWLSKQTHEYHLKAEDKDYVSLSINAMAFLRTQALFTTAIQALEGESRKVFSEFNHKDIHAANFLTKRYESYLKLYTEKQKQADKK